MKQSGPIRVLIVDDSALVRSMLSRVLASEADIEVVGGAKDPYEARELIIAYRPDVILLDIEMPRMDGLTFLKKLMKHYPIPVIMCSGIAPSSSRNALAAVEAGAVDVVCKPSTGGSQALRQLALELADKIRAAAVSMPTASRPRIRTAAQTQSVSFRASGLDPNRYVLAVGASTGGTEAIRNLLGHVSDDWPPIVMVQHMPEGFTKSFAQRLDQQCPPECSEAVDGDILLPGKAFLAPGNIQMMIRSGGTHWRIALGDREPVNRHCPSVDVMFDSIVRTHGKKLIGVLLTGMGADGANGLLNLKHAGALTITQDRASCVVYGMPKVAFELGASDHQAAPADIPRLIVNALTRTRTTTMASR